MTSYQGVAAVTQALLFLLGVAARSAVPEADVTSLRPEQPPAGAADRPRLNIYLVNVTTDPTLRNLDLPTRSPNGDLISVPQAPLTLRYLLSYFGPSQSAQLMLGAVEIALRDNPILTRNLIEQALAAQPQLSVSGLSDQTPPVRLIPVASSLEELSRFWSGFFQMPYTLSTMIDASAAILTSAGTLAGAPTVTGLHVTRGPMPPQLDPFQPVSYETGLHVAVSGPGVRPPLLAQIGASGPWTEVMADEFGRCWIVLPDDCAAGSVTVQLGTRTAAGPQPVPGSRPGTLPIRPRISGVDVSGNSNLTLTVAPTLRPGQTVVVSVLAAASRPESPSMSWTSVVDTRRSTITVALTGNDDWGAAPLRIDLSVDGIAAPSREQTVTGRV